MGQCPRSEMKMTPIQDRGDEQTSSGDTGKRRKGEEHSILITHQGDGDLPSRSKDFVLFCMNLRLMIGWIVLIGCFTLSVYRCLIFYSVFFTLYLNKSTQSEQSEQSIPYFPL
jgi:hypothetical protein